MNNLPLTGTYIAQDGDDNTYQIQITSANSMTGQIAGNYSASDASSGPITASGEIGRYFWVGSPEGGATPFSISFRFSFRPSGWPYCICDIWTGAYMGDNTLVMQGVRSMVTAEGPLGGTLKLTSFRELTFSRQAA